MLKVFPSAPWHSTADPQWFRTVKNPDLVTRLLVCSFAYSTLLTSLCCAHLLANLLSEQCSQIHFKAMSQSQAVLNHSATIVWFPAFLSDRWSIFRAEHQTSLIPLVHPFTIQGNSPPLPPPMPAVPNPLGVVRYHSNRRKLRL